MSGENRRFYLRHALLGAAPLAAFLAYVVRVHHVTDSLVAWMNPLHHWLDASFALIAVGLFHRFVTLVVAEDVWVRVPPQLEKPVQRLAATRDRLLGAPNAQNASSSLDAFMAARRETERQEQL